MPEERPEVSASHRFHSFWSFMLAALLLLLGAAGHVWYLLDDCPLDLAGDEAHYWEWSRHLDLSYYSKGPLVAYIIAAGRALLANWSVEHVGSEMLAVRLPAVLLSVLSGIGMYTVLADTLRSGRLALAAVALTCTVPILAAGSMLMTIDAPLMCAWVWALVCAHRALRSDHWGWWLLTAVLIAIGILAKYTMVLIFPVVGLTILTCPEYRRLVRRPGPYVATLLGLAAGLAPILIWNANHSWVSFRHVAGQAGLEGGPKIDLTGPFAYIAGQLAVVSPVWFVALIWGTIEIWQNPTRETESHRPRDAALLLWATAVPLGFFLLFSFITTVQPNWPVLSLVSGSGVLAFWLARGLRASEAARRRKTKVLITSGILTGGAMMLVGHYMHWLTPAIGYLTRGAPSWDLTPVAKYDPTARLRGWAELGAAVGEIRNQHAAEQNSAFILADDYTVASEIAFYCPGHPDVYCVQSVLGDRRSQYDLWPNPVDDRDQFVGRPCIYVGKLHRALSNPDDPAAGALPNLQRERIVEYRVGEHRLQIWSVYWCERFAGLASGDRERDSGF